jgi:serine/threonine protein phosphatase PrpC
MEDASMIISPFTFKNYSLFGVFDGHGGNLPDNVGPEVALFTQKHFP